MQGHILSFRPPRDDRPILFNRHKHNQLQLAISQDSPTYFRAKNSALHPIVRETIYQNQKKPGVNKQNLELKAIKRLGKSVNVDEMNTMLQRRVQNLNQIEERKINETQSDAEKRVIRAKPYLEESYDIIGHNRKETERGGYIESQRSLFQENYNHIFSEDSGVFKWKSGEFENLADFQSNTKDLLDECDRDRQYKSKPVDLNASINNSKSYSVRTLGNNERLKTLSTAHRKKQALREMTFGQQESTFRLPIISQYTDAECRFFRSGDTSHISPYHSPRDQALSEEHEIEKYLQRHDEFTTQVNKQINKEMIDRLVNQKVPKKNKYPREKLISKKKLQDLRELQVQLEEMDQFDRGIELKRKKLLGKI